MHTPSQVNYSLDTKQTPNAFGPINNAPLKISCPYTFVLPRIEYLDASSLSHILSTIFLYVNIQCNSFTFVM